MTAREDHQAWLHLALSICDEADAIALASFRRDLRVSTKPDRTLVTEADTAIERLARERIRAAHPDHGLIGEEYGTEAGDAPVRWYVDPIDGTHNFVRGVPLFATLLAVESDGELVCGVVSAPALGDRWYASRGGGAWAIHANESPEPRRLAVSTVDAVPDAHLLYGSGGDIVASGRMPGFEPLLRSAWRDRGFGDFWGPVLGAEGAAEAMIVAEAGGRWSDVDGERRLDGGTFVASNGILHDDVLQRLRQRGGD